MLRKETVYFEKSGETNTDECIAIVKREVEDNGYKYIVVASTSGKTGLAFAEALKDSDANLMVVTYDDASGKSLMTDDIRKKIQNCRATIFNGPQMFQAIEMSFGAKFAGKNPSEIADITLNLFGNGIPVCCKSVLAATDSGQIANGIETIAVAGTDKGADTVVVIRATPSMKFKNMRILEVLAKPR